MAEHGPARPTGAFAPVTWPGMTFKWIRPTFPLGSKATVSQLLAGLAVLHNLYIGLSSAEAINSAWPLVVMIEAAVIACWIRFAKEAWFEWSLPFEAQERNVDPTGGGEDADNQEFNVIPAPASCGGTTLVAYQQAPVTRQKAPCAVFAVADRSGGADWTDLMSQVSHELRTPLNAVIGFSDVMNAELLGPLDNPKYREYLAHIRDSGQELLKSAEDTLAVTSLLASRPHKSQPAHPVILPKVVTEAWSFVANEADQKRMSLEVGCEDALSILAETRPLRQTFVNLLAEALKRGAHDTAIQIHAERNCDLVEIEVRAQGNARIQSQNQQSLAVLLAQALLELQGTTLVTREGDNGIWSAMTMFECPLQADFFSAAFDEQTPGAGRFSPCSAY